ncbi:MAG: hypothetical protein K2L01_01840 [Rikenellaceae bacterium]|nr:hypothetical protein [Rikenellaceae bacterium]
MKRIFMVSLAVIVTSVSGIAQDRINAAPAQLSTKSKEINWVLYWEQNPKTGKWKSRDNREFGYLGEGVAVENFNSLFIGEYAGRRYLFSDFMEYHWRYPALQIEWTISRTIMAALISENDYQHMRNIGAGEIITIMPRFYHKMAKGLLKYSFPFFLSLGETCYSADETMYKSYARTHGKDYAERYWESQYPPLYFMVIKRVIDSDGHDVIRFKLYPHAAPEMIDHSYFEVKFAVYQNLFTDSKRKSYK